MTERVNKVSIIQKVIRGDLRGRCGAAVCDFSSMFKRQTAAKVLCVIILNILLVVTVCATVQLCRGGVLIVFEKMFQPISSRLYLI